MYRAIARNKRNTVLILLVFVALLGGLGLFAQYAYGPPGDWTIAVLVVAGAAVYALIQYFLADKQAIAMSGAVGPITKADEPRLYRIVENLSIATGSPMPKVYIVPDPAPNAFATGRDPQHAVVAATTGLLELLDDDELEGVMAHELGHVRNYDIRVSLVVYGLVVAVGILSDILLRMAFYGRGRNGNPVILVFGLVAMIVAPLV
ncbi:MAG: M48 family metalloprotease, partial [Actinomycetota bacterium]|nr:M48 family metalloprotease [Actinomycetota bacterium]